MHIAQSCRKWVTYEARKATCVLLTTLTRLWRDTPDYTIFTSFVFVKRIDCCAEAEDPVIACSKFQWILRATGQN